MVGTSVAADLNNRWWTGIVSTLPFARLIVDQRTSIDQLFCIFNSSMSSFEMTLITIKLRFKINLYLTLLHLKDNVFR